MPESWMNTLTKYRYPVNLSNYCGAHNFPNHFKQNIIGDRETTIKFENYFRENCLMLEPWFEVIFWKLNSQPDRAQIHTCTVVKQLTEIRPVSPSYLLGTAQKFMESVTRKNFVTFRKLFFSSNVIATVATYPAFLNPEIFPMVDTRVAKWVNSQYTIHNLNDPLGPQLIPSVFGISSKSTVLTSADFDFYYYWILWTRHMAKKMNEISNNFHWRARDIEMAVFTAWGDQKGRKTPLLHLNPI